jgi:hypothetical protein
MLCPSRPRTALRILSGISRRYAHEAEKVELMGPNLMLAVRKDETC